MLLCQRNRGQSGQGHFGQNQNWKVKICHYSINIYIYTIVSNDRVSEIDFDHFDLDHFDRRKQILSWPGVLSSYVHKIKEIIYAFRA